jgi:2-aminoadipate transaminase
MKSSALSELGRRTAMPPISWLMHQALSRPGLISLAAGFTDNETLPVREVGGAVREVLGSRRTARPALQYGDTTGDPFLRELTARHLRRLDEGGTPGQRPRIQGRQPAVPPGVYAPDRLLITNGSQQLLYLTAEALCNPGDIVLVEDPTYFVFLGIVQSHGLRARGVRMVADGMDLEHLERVLESLKRSGELPRVKLLYLVSYFQNPTGITTSFRRKVGVLQLLKRFERAAGHPIYLVEDAAYRELRFAGADEPSTLAARGFGDRVIYTGTYSKPFATGLRVGFGVLPEPLFTAVMRIKGNHDFGTASFLQQTLARAIAAGRYERHLADLQKRYANKARVMKRALRKYFPTEVEWDEPKGGLYFWARLPKAMKAGVKSKLFDAALANDVLYVPGELCYADDPTRRKPNREIRLSFGNAREADIREGIARLGAVLRRMIRRRKDNQHR